MKLSDYVYAEWDCGVLYQGDCLEVLPLLDGISIDSVVTSPPYNCGMEYEDAMSAKAWVDWCEDWFYLTANCLERGGFSCVNLPNYVGSREERIYVLDEIRPAFDRHMQFVDLVIWQKSPANGSAWGNFRTSPRMRASHEWIFIYGTGDQLPRPSDIEWEEWSRFTDGTWVVPPILPFADKHPATFPEEIPHRLVMLYSPAGGLVLDPFAGTGTTAGACIKTGRRFAMIEKNPGYCAIAKARIDRELQQPRLPFVEPLRETQSGLFGIE